MGVDLELQEPSLGLEQASGLLLPRERAWVGGLPESDRWLAILRCWTAKEALLKAIGQGFAFGLDQVELAPAEGAEVRLVRLCGSEDLARGWKIEFHGRTVEGRTYLAALAVG